MFFRARFGFLFCFDHIMVVRLRRIAFATRRRADDVIAAGIGWRIAGGEGVRHLGIDFLFLGLCLFAGREMLRHFFVRLVIVGLVGLGGHVSLLLLVVPAIAGAPMWKS